ncbi:MAG: DUF1127 domain-containing protein [Alphaproteobacteria bacterium]
MHISDPLLRAFLTAAHAPDPFAAAGRTAEVPKATLAVHRSITFVACLLRNTLGALRIRRNRRATLHELSALPDATLKDIGLPRSEIRYVAETLNRPTPIWRPCSGRGVKPVAANDDEAEAAA